MSKVAGQEAEALASFHSRAHENNTTDAVRLQCLYRTSHGQVSLARARRTNAESEVMPTHLTQILHLVGTTPANLAAERLHLHLVRATGTRFHQRQMYVFWTQPAARALIKHPQDIAAHLRRSTNHVERIALTTNF